MSDETVQEAAEAVDEAPEAEAGVAVDEAPAEGAPEDELDAVEPAGDDDAPEPVADAEAVEPAGDDDEPEPVADAEADEAIAGPRAREGLATLYLCERGHRTLAVWSEPPAVCHAAISRRQECGRPVYHSTELPEQVQKALNPLKASRKSRKG